MITKCPHCGESIRVTISAETADAVNETDGSLDAIEQSIIQDGYIPNNNIWRRWIMAQMLRHYQDPNTGADTFNKYFIKDKPYSYQWKVLINELKAIKRMSPDSPERKMRLQFFNPTLCLQMLYDYNGLIDQIPEKHYGSYWKGKYGKGKYGRWSNVCTTMNKPQAIAYVSSQIRCLADYYIGVNRSTSSAAISTAINVATTFLSKMPVKCRTMPKSKAWINAFKGNGAYYTMDNMIKFHNCHFSSVNANDKDATQQSLAELHKQVYECNGEFYKLFGCMKEFIDYNDYSLETLANELNENE